MHWMDRLMRLDFKVFLPECTLYAQDAIATAHSLKDHMPFLDVEMLNLSMRVPWKYKVPGWTTKLLVRKAMEGLLPRKILTMKKRVFLFQDPSGLKRT